MGRRLSDEERVRRIIGSVHVRTMAGQGKCQMCKSKVKRGEKSLRYTTIVYGRKQEVGICMTCTARVWKHAESLVGEISAIVEDFKDEADADADPEPDSDPIREERKSKLLVMSPKPQQPAAPQPEPEPCCVVEEIRQEKAKREAMMREFFGTSGTDEL